MSKKEKIKKDDLDQRGIWIVCTLWCVRLTVKMWGSHFQVCVGFRCGLVLSSDDGVRGANCTNGKGLKESEALSITMKVSSFTIPKHRTSITTPLFGYYVAVSQNLSITRSLLSTTVVARSVSLTWYMPLCMA